MLRRLRLVLANFKLKLDHRLLVVVEAHLSVEFIVFFVLKERDPLLIGAEPAVKDNELGDGDTADVLREPSSFADQSDVLVGDLGGEGDPNGGFLRVTQVLNVELALT